MRNLPAKSARSLRHPAREHQGGGREPLTIYRKAKSEKAHRFWGIFVHVTRKETLEEPYRIAKRNGGAAGIDGQTFEAIETVGLDGFLAAIRDDLETGRYKPHPNRRVDIPKEQGKFRTLQIPCIRDRVVQGALKLFIIP